MRAPITFLLNRILDLVLDAAIEQRRTDQLERRIEQLERLCKIHYDPADNPFERLHTEDH